MFLSELMRIVAYAFQTSKTNKNPPHGVKSSSLKQLNFRDTPRSSNKPNVSQDLIGQQPLGSCNIHQRYEVVSCGNTQLKTAFTPQANASEMRFTCLVQVSRTQNSVLKVSMLLQWKRSGSAWHSKLTKIYWQLRSNQKQSSLYQISTKLLLWGWNAWLLHANAQQKEWPFCILQIRFVKVSRYIGFSCKPTFSCLSTVTPKHVIFLIRKWMWILCVKKPYLPWFLNRVLFPHQIERMWIKGTHGAGISKRKTETSSTDSTNEIFPKGFASCPTKNKTKNRWFTNKCRAWHDV